MLKGAAVVGLVVVLAGCSGGGSHEAAPVSTVPIATEAPTTAVSTSTAVVTTAATVTTTTVAPYTTVPVLIRTTAKTPAEQEIIDAMKVLLPIQYRVALNMDVDEAVVRAGYTGQAVVDVLANIAEASALGLRATPGNLDRMVVTGVRRVNPELAAARGCFVNNAKTFDYSKGKVPRLVDDETVSIVFDYQVELTTVGWRFAGAKPRSTRKGDSTCAF